MCVCAYVHVHERMSVHVCVCVIKLLLANELTFKFLWDQKVVKFMV